MSSDAALAGAHGPAAELVFQQAVEGLFHVGLRGRITPELSARLRERGLDLSRPLAPAYPRQSWNGFIQVAAETLWPGEPEETAYHALGQRLVLGYAETLVGKAILGMLRVIGPRRTLERMTRNLRSGSNFNLCTTTQLSPTETLFWINEPDVHPAFSQGMLEEALKMAGARGLSIDVEKRDAKGCTYRVRWNA